MKHTLLILLLLLSTRLSAQINPEPAPGKAPDVRPISKLSWSTDLKQALAKAKRLHRNVFIDFTGYYCTNARMMEATVFKNPEVISLLENFVLVRLYCDDDTPDNKANARLEKKRFKTVAIPSYVILSPQNKKLALFEGQTRDEQAFIDFIKNSTPPQSE
ncbi:MAG: thioredoxin family protein [Bacteroidota bacterium]|nr:thioredoxin family protein [Bacteroidota bacterium]MDP4235094.1 thioredoxin family protein [Bacteroidota bacterium]